MRFLVYGEPWRWGMPGSLHAALECLGHGAVLFDFTQYLFREQFSGRIGSALDRGMYRIAAARINRELQRCCSQNLFDVVIVCKGAHLWPETIELARRHAQWVVNWNFDEFFNPLHMSPYTAASFSLYSLILTPRRHLVAEYYKRGARRVEYLPFCYDPKIHYPVSVEPSERALWGGGDVVFAGSWSRRREDLIAALSSLRVKIWGASWKHARRSFRRCNSISIGGRPAECENMSRAFNSSIISLNILTIENRDQYNVRNLEIPGCAAFQLCERTDEVIELFDEGKEIACYGSTQELVDKARYYATHPRECEAISKAGYKRVLAGRHSYVDRATCLLKVLQEE